jgi:hypothetical protein
MPTSHATWEHTLRAPPAPDHKKLVSKRNSRLGVQPVVFGQLQFSHQHLVESPRLKSGNDLLSTRSRCTNTDTHNER